MSKFPIFDTYPDYCSGIEYYHQKSKSEDHYCDTEGLSMGSCRKAERIRGSSTGRACVGCSPVSPAGCWQPEPGEALRGAGSQREGQRPLLIESLSLSYKMVCCSVAVGQCLPGKSRSAGFLQDG